MLVEVSFVRGLSGKLHRFRTSEPHEPNQAVHFRAVAEFPGFLQAVRVDDGRDSTVVSIRCAGIELLERPLPALLFNGPRPYPLTMWCPAGHCVDVELLRDALPARWSLPPEA